jgi:hypothetical protein
MWSEPAPRWELFEGRTREPESGSRTDAIITLTFALIVVAVAFTALGWWLVRTDALQPVFHALQRVVEGMGGA